MPRNVPESKYPVPRLTGNRLPRFRNIPEASLSSRSEDGSVRYATEKELNVHQLPCRIHESDWIMLKKLLEDSHLRWQGFIDACVDAFLLGDPSIMKVVRDWEEKIRIPRDKLDRLSLSHRERDAMLDELDRIEEKERE